MSKNKKATYHCGNNYFLDVTISCHHSFILWAVCRWWEIVNAPWDFSTISRPYIHFFLPLSLKIIKITICLSSPSYLRSFFSGGPFPLLFLPRLRPCKWHQGHKAGEFDSIGDHTLVFVAETGWTGLFYLERARNELAQNIGLFVINVIYFVLAGGAGHG